MNDSEREAMAEATFKRLIAENHDAIAPIAHWGDGRCGYLLHLLQTEFSGVIHDIPPSTKPSKVKIKHALARRVFERDAYRCVQCGSHLDLTCDHVIPESLGGPTTYENLQTMCRPCNSRKGARA